MKSAIVLLSALFMAPAAFASQVVCTGDYFGYQFTMSGKIEGNKVVGKASVVISDGDSVVKSASMTIASSSFNPGRSLQMAGGIDGLGQGNLNANFDGRSNSYKGQMDAGTSMGTFHISTTCSVH